ncbi:D-2-hydroxyacid dehydrogenase [Simiduia litorea]|uniref:D-2-hydroxyacid dehydrogenase n=1 Tax=Simiduia litorea TaxID=1435348 RepID=UPI0036F43536
MTTTLTCVIAAENAATIARCLSRQKTKLPCAAPKMIVVDDQQALAEVIDQADILLAQPAWAAPHLHKAKKMRWLQSTFAGVEPLVSKGCRKDYQLTGVKNIFGPLISEYVFAAVLAHSRHSAYYRACQRDKMWQPVPYQALSKQTIAIVGLGSIGGHLVQTAQHFGMSVLGVNRTGKPVAGLDKVVALAALGDQLRAADIVVLTLPSTPATQQLVDKKFLAKLKKSALLINVGRGALVNESDLLAALVAGDLAAAVLDVFCSEPLPPNSPLWQVPNLTITPHIAAVTFADDIAGIFAKNLQRFVEGQALDYAIDFDRGY